MRSERTLIENTKANNHQGFEKFFAIKNFKKGNAFKFGDFYEKKDYLLNVHEESYADSKGHIGNE